jgi:hypothetical protein
MGFSGKAVIAVVFLGPFSLYLGLYAAVFLGLFVHGDWMPLVLSIRWWLAGLFANHGVSFFLDYLADGEFRRSRSENYIEPLFRRLTMTNLTLLAVAGIFTVSGVWLVMIAFVIFKVIKDLRYEAVLMLQADPKNIYLIQVFFEDTELLNKKFKGSV